MKNSLRITLLLVAVIATKLAMAQGMPDDPDIQVPVDGGIFTVVGSAVAYGVHRLRNKKKNSNDTDI